MEEKRNYCVYMHKFPNGKIYVGQTVNIKQRWKHGSGYKKDQQPLMYNAIQKYGWENIEHIILKKDLTLEEANFYEQKYIEYYKCNIEKYGYEYGYNMTDGGEGVLGKKISEKQKQRISECNSGRKHTEQEKEKMKKNHCDFKKENNPNWGKRGEDSPNFGRTKSTEEIQKIKDSWTEGKKQWRS